MVVHGNNSWKRKSYIGDEMKPSSEISVSFVLLVLFATFFIRFYCGFIDLIKRYLTEE